ncbi:midasin [Thozetella sp. PMI_491]|nr:midasin [Thozetella sp. PMI_491]
MTTVDVSPQRVSLLGDTTVLQFLPPDLLQIIQDHHSNRFLEALSRAALIPVVADRVFAHAEHIFADICARWTLHAHSNDVQVIAAFARLLPFAPHLSIFLNKFLAARSSSGQDPSGLLDLQSLTPQDLGPLLLALWRLNSFEKRTYSALAKPSQIQALFQDRSQTPVVRYLAIRIFCQLHDAADTKLEAMIKKWIQEDGKTDADLVGDFDGRKADYTFLSLHEHARAGELSNLRASLQQQTLSQATHSPLPPQNLTPFVLHYGKTVFPRPLGPVNTSSALVQTPTSTENLERLIILLQNPGPILLHGVSGSGKTSLVGEVARELGKDEGLVTLHLNEQTDAKMLLGLYTTDSKPGSFQWQPGVLTTAVREGRWVLIEDLDRAPTEVMSTLLPLIERGELLIPSRGERIQAASGFRIFSTVRTSLGMNGKENLPSLIGLRLWQLLPVTPLPQPELRDVINGSFPILHKYTPGILSVFNQLLASTTGASRLSLGRGIIERPISTRDLLKWCRRLDQILKAEGCRTGEEPITETTRDRMFYEAIDCFLGSIKEPTVREALIAGIAKEMHLSAERIQHYLRSYIPELRDTDTHITIGRISFSKSRRAGRIAKSKRPFATTTHAKRLLEQISAAIRLAEPLLLVGETGIGKTTVVQQLAESLGHKLVVVNLSQQSEGGDLLGGFKPVNSRSLAVPLKEEFEDLWEKTGISTERNHDYLERINKRFAKSRWSEVSKEWRKAPRMFETILAKIDSKANSSGLENGNDQPAKRRKTESSKRTALLKLKPRWEAFSQSLDSFDRQITGGANGFAFAFVEGNIVKAARNGDWVLLDEINLASPDTLESIAGLFQSSPNESPSILLSEKGEMDRIKAHPEFRVFGNMNPSGDAGKKDLPIGLRSRFTEIYVGSPDRDKKDLLTIIKAYLKGVNDRLADSIATLYLEIKALSDSKKIVDGANEVPHFSLRSLTRVLTYANDVSSVYRIERALYEGFCMVFLTVLDQSSETSVLPLIHQHLLKDLKILSQIPKRPSDGRSYVSFKSHDKDHQYWLVQGAETPIERPDYIITPYVERNLLNLVRATSTRRYPVLIQGPTSAGKTSMIEYLANFSGNKFVRINNHEHTDLQEYLGTYVSGSDGRLKFQEGLLVQAMRQGSWIVLDELNLASTDILEALNRLLDDNRELLIPETQEVVRPHENFMLFATQNPPGLYGGRKILSRAFRNRFLELHFDDIPENELETILQKRSRNTAPSDCRRIVEVYKQLSRLRQESRLFEQKNSFATLRDLFRWALREGDLRQDIADNGFMLLAERVRKPEERMEVKRVIEDVFKVKIDPGHLYGPKSVPVRAQNNSQEVTWTKAMRRLYVLVRRAIQNNEPVLLVGETGCGKTTVCQVLAEVDQKELHIVNAHQNTETGDLIGSQRPVRNRSAILDSLKQNLLQAASFLGEQVGGTVEQLQAWYAALSLESLAKLPVSLKNSISVTETRSKALFEWCDGSLVHAMKTGQFFLLDEISLADDSVLERLNSVLEPQRSLLLAEKGSEDAFVQASNGFKFLATMNPGGDWGKKELSPALRNRFTEIWVPPLSEDDDIHDIISSKLDPKFTQLRDHESRSTAAIIVEFTSWFGKTFRPSSATAFSLRDILAWVEFMNKCPSPLPEFALLHGAATVFIDTIGANPSALLAVDPKEMEAQRQVCLEKLGKLSGCSLTSLYLDEPQVRIDNTVLSIGDFSIARSNATADHVDEFRAPTTKMNAMRVIRALQVNKPVLLEGNPGVGKTTLVSALARACGRPLTRINLSDQTDLMDLFGTDVPVEGAEAGNFAWKDAPFLQAMKKGNWVLLDEMNLASQSVLEGLNACLDHRGEVYISELDQVFKKSPDFKIFAAQNPHHQGGGRKGLPSSFVNRFIVVYADVFTEQDLLLITASKKYDKIDQGTRHKMIEFISALDDEVVLKKSFGSLGSPWEFNLRDTLRWLDLLTTTDALLSTAKLDDFLDVVIRQRFRTIRDRQEVNSLFAKVFSQQPRGHHLYHDISPSSSQVGFGNLPRNALAQETLFPCIDPIPRLAEIESIMVSIRCNIPCILVGPSGAGKSALLRHVAALAGKALVVFPLNADVDIMDLIGGFEQADPLRDLNSCLSQLRQALRDSILENAPQSAPATALDLMAETVNWSSRPQQISNILLMIKKLRNENTLHRALEAALATAEELLQQPLTLDNPRFQWLDGVIVRAVESGQWLVLDNANLCSASVLDRLNSLLERPNGYLSINEHTGPGGEPRIIMPHPNFRIFLTVDPRYGELSRAMRNRSIEVFLDGKPPRTEDYLEKITPVESTLHRFSTAVKVLDRTQSTNKGGANLEPLAFDLISLADTGLLKRYISAAGHGLHSQERHSTIVQHLNLLASYTEAESARPLRHAISAAYNGAPNSMLLPVNPLQNAPVAQMLEQGRVGIAHWLSICYEAYLELYAAQREVKQQLTRVNIKKPALLNRLQRSHIAGEVATLSKDSTVNAERFLASVFTELNSYLQGNLESAESWRERSTALRKILFFWKQTFDSLCAMPFMEARFQAHLIHGSKLFQESVAGAEDGETGELFSKVLHNLDDAFVVGFKLSTGLSMEAVWALLRPEPIRDAQGLDQVIEMESLAVRFDALRWKVNASVSDLGTIITSLSQAYSLVRMSGRDAGDLVKDLMNEVGSLESKINESSVDRPPFFATGFESLRKAMVLHHASQPAQSFGIVSGMLILSNLPTLSEMRLQTAKGNRFSSLDYLLAQTAGVHPWAGQLSELLLQSCDSTATASLWALQSVELELPLLGKHLIAASEAISVDPLAKLSALLLELISGVIAVHGDGSREFVQSFYKELLRRNEFSLDLVENASQLDQSLFRQTPSWPSHVLSLFKEHFSRALLALAAVEKGVRPRSAYASVAWVQFSLGCIKLYVPDKVFDPYLRAQVEMVYHDSYLQTLRQKIEDLRTFEVAFTGQETNLRLDILSDELRGIDELPSSIPAIYRPSGEGLVNLQGEFSNVLSVLVNHDISSSHFHYLSTLSESDAQELDLIRENTTRLIQRLLGRFSAFQDLTMPLVSFLRCLEVGLSLLANIPSASHNSQQTLASLAQATPFINGTARLAEGTELPLRSFEFLTFIQSIVALEGFDGLSASLRRLLFDSFASFHEEWAKKIEADRKAEEAKTSLYRFKGSLEDEEEFDQQDFDALFPTYQVDGEDDQIPKKRVQHSVRDLSVLLAEAHEKIFLHTQDAQESLQRLCKQVARKLTQDGTWASAEDINKDNLLLPATILILDERTQALNATVDASAYNFYTDPHLIEVRQVLGLVHDIKTRFQYLKTVDEISHHQTLDDVIMACDKVLDMSADEPLAMIITGIERLHTHVYEWHEGGWASRIHKAQALFERLRDTICDWRRLELSSWARLFDMEQVKCREDAKSWWFLAYSAIILAPCSRLEEGQDLKTYAVELLHLLESYFSETVIGQFTPRLNLVRQLKRNLDLLVQDGPDLAVVRDGVQNFIAFYSRYEPKAIEAVKRGRLPLDKSVKDVLFMAKWRDKNINALRESARKSHQKLFKLVRKFRAVLGQPMKPIIEQGLPDEEHQEPAPIGGSPELDIDSSAISLSANLLPGIQKQAQWERLAQPEILAKAMYRHGSLPAGAIQASETLDAYITDLVSGMAALRKETPGVLTDENKEQVKHLKSRKTRLYIDTLATIRQMGFSRSLGTKTLDRQKSTQLVLSETGLVDLQSAVRLEAVEYYYHKTLDLAPRFRSALTDHSEEINRENINRSVGFLEGILYVMFQQRQYLSRAAKTLSALDCAISSIKDLSLKDMGGTIIRQMESTNHQQVICWVVQILRLGIRLVETHAKLGGVNNSHPQAKLEDQVVNFLNLEQQLDKLPKLVPGFDSSRHKNLRDRIDTGLEILESDLRQLAQERTDLAFIMEQIALWTSVQRTAVLSDGQDHGFKSFVTGVMTISSKILVAIQNFGAESKTLPASVEEPSWLIRYSGDLSKSINALRIQSICDEVHGILQLLKNLDLDEPANGEAASALLRVVLPVLQQYSAVCSRNVAQYADLHRATSKLGYTLSKSFVQLASQGFCTPKEQSDEKGGDSGKLEGGTGLGDGEGAEDISKDIQPDEDMTELAQEPNTQKEDEMEDEKDAVDMGEDDLEGDLGSVGGEEEEDDKDNKSGEEKDEEDEMDEEAGDVDDLDPTAVDEKMWDGEQGEDADKDQQGDDNKGQNKDDEQAAADDKKKGEKDEIKPEEAGEEGDPDLDEELAQEQDEAQQQEELNRQDQNVQESEALDLPDDMELDGDDGESASGDDELDNLDQLSDIEKPEEADGSESDTESTGGQDHHEDPAKGDESEVEEDDVQANAEDQKMDVDPEEQHEEPQGEEQEQSQLPEQQDETTEQENVAPSEAKSGGGQAQMEMDGQDEDNSESKASQAQQGTKGEDSADQDMSAGSKGAVSKSDQEQAQPEDNQAAEAQDAQPFKKLGDALERWHRSQRDIHDAPQDEEAQQNKGMDESEMARAEFQHLQDEEAEADTQALGTATDEEARPMDDAMAIDNEAEETQTHMMPDDVQDEPGPEEEIQDSEHKDVADVPPTERDNDRTGVATHKGAYDVEDDPMQGLENDENLEESEDEQIQETSTQLSTTHITEVEQTKRDFSEAVNMWTTFQTKTHPLSLSLTAQLRLILTPSQSTKLSGAFRTGKRLNIKKIIPYIASSYKRDKIWMRRAIPTKRAYQILLCVDDSSSMGETSSGALALESFVMVSRALTLLEAGQVGVLGFGTDVFTAHDLAQPFAGHDAGARVLQRFTFQQQGTDMCRLLRSVIEQFRSARLQNTASGGEDLWQLALILSDGLVQSGHHARIRPLLREAMEARIMVVFIVMDDANKSKGESVLTLKEAKFTPDGGIVVERYLDSFPFPYYLMVHHLEDLPGALAGLLRTWFAEVNS